MGAPIVTEEVMNVVVSPNITENIHIETINNGTDTEVLFTVTNIIKEAKKEDPEPTTPSKKTAPGSKKSYEKSNTEKTTNKTSVKEDAKNEANFIQKLKGKNHENVDQNKNEKEGKLQKDNNNSEIKNDLKSSKKNSTKINSFIPLPVKVRNKSQERNNHSGKDIINDTNKKKENDQKKSNINMNLDSKTDKNNTNGSNTTKTEVLFTATNIIKETKKQGPEPTTPSKKTTTGSKKSDEKSNTEKTTNETSVKKDAISEANFIPNLKGKKQENGDQNKNEKEGKLQKDSDNSEIKKELKSSGKTSSTINSFITLPVKVRKKSEERNKHSGNAIINNTKKEKENDEKKSGNNKNLDSKTDKNNTNVSNTTIIESRHNETKHRKYRNTLLRIETTRNNRSEDESKKRIKGDSSETKTNTDSEYKPTNEVRDKQILEKDDSASNNNKNTRNYETVKQSEIETLPTENIGVQIISEGDRKTNPRIESLSLNPQSNIVFEYRQEIESVPKSISGLEYDNTDNTRSTLGLEYDNTENTESTPGIEYNNTENTKSTSGIKYDNIDNTKSTSGLEYDNTDNTKSTYEIEYDYTDNTRSTPGLEYDNTDNTESTPGIEYENTENTKRTSGIKYDNIDNAKSTSGLEYDNKDNTKSTYEIEYDNTDNIESTSGLEYDNTDNTESTSGKEYENTDNTKRTSGIEYDNTDNTKGTSGLKYYNTDNTKKPSGIGYDNTDNIESTFGLEHDNADDTERTSGIVYDYTDNIESTSGLEYDNTDNTKSTSLIECDNTNDNERTSGIEYHNTDNTERTPGIEYDNTDNTKMTSGIEYDNKDNTKSTSGLKYDSTKSTYEIEYDYTDNTESISGIEYNNTDNIESTSGLEYDNTGDTESTSGIEYDYTDNIESTSGLEYDYTDNTESFSGIEYDNTDDTKSTSGIEYDNTDDTKSTSGIEYDNTDDTKSTSGIEYDYTGNTKRTSGIEYDNTDDTKSTSGIEYDYTDNTKSTSGIEYDYIDNTENTSEMEYDNTGNTDIAQEEFIEDAEEPDVHKTFSETYPVASSIQYETPVETNLEEYSRQVPNFKSIQVNKYSEENKKYYEDSENYQTYIPDDENVDDINNPNFEVDSNIQTVSGDEDYEPNIKDNFKTTSSTAKVYENNINSPTSEDYYDAEPDTPNTENSGYSLQTGEKYPENLEKGVDVSVSTAHIEKPDSNIEINSEIKTGTEDVDDPENVDRNEYSTGPGFSDIIGEKSDQTFETDNYYFEGIQYSDAENDEISGNEELIKADAKEDYLPDVSETTQNNDENYKHTEMTQNYNTYDGITSTIETEAEVENSEPIKTDAREEYLPYVSESTQNYDNRPQTENLNYENTETIQNYNTYDDIKSTVETKADDENSEPINKNVFIGKIKISEQDLENSDFDENDYSENISDQEKYNNETSKQTIDGNTGDDFNSKINDEFDFNAETIGLNDSLAVNDNVKAGKEYADFGGVDSENTEGNLENHETNFSEYTIDNEATEENELSDNQRFGTEHHNKEYSERFYNNKELSPTESQGNVQAFRKVSENPLNNHETNVKDLIEPLHSIPEKFSENDINTSGLEKNNNLEKTDKHENYDEGFNEAPIKIVENNAESSRKEIPNDYVQNIQNVAIDISTSQVKDGTTNTEKNEDVENLPKTKEIYSHDISETKSEHISNNKDVQLTSKTNRDDASFIKSAGDDSLKEDEKQYPKKFETPTYDAPVASESVIKKSLLEEEIWNYKPMETGTVTVEAVPVDELSNYGTVIDANSNVNKFNDNQPSKIFSYNVNSKGRASYSEYYGE